MCTPDIYDLTYYNTNATSQIIHFTKSSGKIDICVNNVHINFDQVRISNDIIKPFFMNEGYYMITYMSGSMDADISFFGMSSCVSSQTYPIIYVDSFHVREIFIGMEDDDHIIIQVKKYKLNIMNHISSSSLHMAIKYEDDSLDIYNHIKCYDTHHMLVYGWIYMNNNNIKNIKHTKETFIKNISYGCHMIDNKYNRYIITIKCKIYSLGIEIIKYYIESIIISKDNIIHINTFDNMKHKSFIELNKNIYISDNLYIKRILRIKSLIDDDYMYMYSIQGTNKIEK
jgi:hypothetical protein